MNSLTAAASLVPKYTMNSMGQEIKELSLSKLLDILVLPRKNYASNLIGVVQHFRKVDETPVKELITGVIESFREFQELSRQADDHQSTGFHILRRIARWGFARIVKWLFKVAFRMMYRLAHWIFKKIIVNGVKALVDWVVRPILIEALGAIGFDPALWPFIAIAGGASALGYSTWNMFFGKPKGAKIPILSTQVQSILKAQEDTSDDLGEIPPAPEGVSFDPYDKTIPISTVLAANSLIQAQAPEPVGTAVTAGPPKSASAKLAEARAAAKESEDKYGIPASVTLAQWALESNYGAEKSMPPGSNNPFGIKARPGEPYVETMTTEFIGGQLQRVSQKFAKYNSIEEAFEAHARLLATGRPYIEARTHSADPKAFAQALTGIYATDPNYGSKLISIMNRLGVDTSAKSSTQVTADYISNTPGISVPSQQSISTQPTVQGSAVTGSLVSSSKQKTFIRGPQGSIVAVS